MTNLFRMCLCMLAAVSLLAAPTASAQLLGPSAPTALAAWATAPGEVTLSWEPASSVTGVTAYRVYRFNETGERVHLVDVPADQLSVAESGLPAGTTVTYVVSAVDVLGEGPASEPASATTWSVPDAPQGVATTSGPGLVGEATISWQAPASDGGAALLAYHVYRDGALVAVLDAATNAFTDTGLTPLQAYSYQVSAVNAVGEGLASDATCGVASPWAAELGCQALF